jgi:predicted  nucleic acid-binding Zn-ribbon protein
MINKEDINKITNGNLSNEVSEKTLEIARLIESLGSSNTAGYKNLIALKDYTVMTREMFRALQQENELYKNQIKQLNVVIEQIKSQVQHLQVKLYSKKPTG